MLISEATISDLSVIADLPNRLIDLGFTTEHATVLAAAPRMLSLLRSMCERPGAPAKLDIEQMLACAGIELGL